MFKSFSHFQCISLYGERVCSNFIDLYVVVRLSKHYLLKKLFLLYIFALLLCQRLIDHRCVGLFQFSILFHWSIYLFLCQCHTTLITVQSLSRVRLFVTPRTAACQASLSITNSWSLLRLMPIELVMPSNHFILPCPLLLLSSSFSSIRVFSNESVLCIRWPNYWNFSFSISPSSEYSGLISFRIDWLELLAVQGTLKSLLQHHSSEASIL